MDLIDRYLNAVAAQLPQSERVDIIAELRDMILSRCEQKEEALGRPLTPAEQEEILREVGHPLIVAARYGSGPQHVVGPELYPWWIFGVKAGLIAITAIALLGIVVRVIVGDVEAGQAVGQAFRSVFNSGIILIGFATVAALIIERQKSKPRFLREWRVQDLSLFEFGGGLNFEALSRGRATGEWEPSKLFVSAPTSPTVRALASAVGAGVVLLWWIGWLPLTHTTPESFGAVVGGVDYVEILGQLHTLLYWPVIAVLLVRIAFDLTRAAHPEGVRFTALGDIGFGLAEAALFAWLWIASPLSPVVYEPTIEAVVGRVREMIDTGWWTVGGILMLIVVFGFLHAAWRVLRAVVRLVTGKA
ncbi:hypothetical protein GCM10009422_01760 [Brevundimonas kwangchunensis]|uniref:Uncharacterized protein n=1 Tax=Brevundimonas kwangchunensis TaxID=322163 RepID=A0ABP3RMT0_9CAUL